jgi:hypothetical protein
MEKQKIVIIQILDDNIMRRIDDDSDIQNIISLSKNLKLWCDYHNYDHHVHYLTDDYKNSEEFKNYMYNDYTKIHVYNIENNGHSKIYGFIKTLECLISNEYDYVCMLDMDIGYVEMTRSIENYLESINATNKSMVAALECIDPNEYYNGRSPNGGVYLFKNTDWTKRLLEGLIMSQTRIGYSNHRMTNCLIDQMQMSFISMVCPDCDEHFLITKHYDSIQKWYSHNNYSFDLENYKSVFFHFAGTMKRDVPHYYNTMDENGGQMIRDYKNFENFTIKH